jgi:hypothetical protein
VFDEAEERIQAENPFDRNFKEEIERKVAEQLRGVSLQARLDDLFSLEELENAIGKLKRHAAPKALFKLSRKIFESSPKSYIGV